MPVERAAYWSRVRPELTAVRPPNLRVSTVTTYAMPRGERDLRDVVNVWLQMRQASGESDEARDYWVDGSALTARAPRWSLLSALLQRSQR